MSSVTGVITAKWNGGRRPGPPTFGVLHDAETPLEAGYARAIAKMFASTTTQKSATYMVDPVDTIQLLDEGLVAWHCGNANPRSIGVEQAGYAAFTLAQWSTAAAFVQEERVAQLMREIRDRHGIGLYWMTDQQLRDAHAGRIVGGWATHDQCSRVIGGSTHTDPAPNYPLARLAARANGNPGGFLMALTDAEQHEILDRLRGDTSRGYDMLQSIEGLAKDIEVRVRGTHPAMDSLQVIQWQVSQLAAAAPTGVDADKLAAALAAAIPDGIAEQVAQKLAARLAA